ncbi:MAG: hypothetical protein R3C09_15010 [Pirellulaceae bacterium]
MALASIAMMAFAWVISCGTRLYDVPESQVEALRDEKLAPIQSGRQPSGSEAKSGQGWQAWLAEPPFVKPPDDAHRKWNYWMMSQPRRNVVVPDVCGGLLATRLSAILHRLRLVRVATCLLPHVRNQCVVGLRATWHGG